MIFICILINLLKHSKKYKWQTLILNDNSTKKNVKIHSK